MRCDDSIWHEILSSNGGPRNRIVTSFRRINGGMLTQTLKRRVEIVGEYCTRHCVIEARSDLKTGG